MIRVKILKTDKDIKDFSSIDDYLLHTYGEKKLEESKKDREFTFLDVVGYTLDSRDFEKEDGKYYELNEIENCMYEKRDKKKI